MQVFGVHELSINNTYSFYAQLMESTRTPLLTGIHLPDYF